MGDTFIAIETELGPRLISADEVPGTDGILAVNMHRGGFALTHVPTGHAVAIVKDRSAATKIGERIWAALSVKQRTSWRSTSAATVRRATPKAVCALVEGESAKS